MCHHHKVKTLVRSIKTNEPPCVQPPLNIGQRPLSLVYIEYSSSPFVPAGQSVIDVVILVKKVVRLNFSHCNIYNLSFCF